MTKEATTHRIDLTKHKIWVAWYLFKVCWALIKRAAKHDLSKYGKEESLHFERVLSIFKTAKYGTQAYQDAVASLGPALGHHYDHNPHHPEHYMGGIAQMSPLDLVEMLCDWKAASKRYNSNFTESLEIGRKKFGYSDYQNASFEDFAKEVGL